ncbi:mas-related G-protein coupled receptor member H-like [Heteronotia binoei]|uniref:mas-related G-protein coupled receptor member H-like n=1 Tax=Heteronotia binoei TaxID=13085 RepID=UPI00292E88E9|nr:mas-related G-protein coupled receptor member H-like [Heteronotia binoei]
MVSTSSAAPPFSREENTVENNDTDYCDGFQAYEWSIYSLTAFSCLCGLVGNSTVIWLLSFCIKRNPFTTYILNLAIADFGTLLNLSARVVLLLPRICNTVPVLAFSLLFPCIFFTYSASLYFLTAISVERCLSVLFPIWYRCHRPERSSAVVSFLLWTIPGLLSGLLLVFNDYLVHESYLNVMTTIFTVNLLIFTPIMVASTLIMSIKICHSSKRRQPPRLYITISITLLFFVILAVPFSVTYFVMLNTGLASLLLYDCSYLFASFNSSINPIIYYFVGRGREKRRESLKVVLKRAFRDEAICKGGS